MVEEQNQGSKPRPWYKRHTTQVWLLGLGGSAMLLTALILGVILGGGNREHIVPVGTVVAGSVAALVALGQLQVARRRHDEQTKADIQRRITESFTKPVEQLASDKLVAHLGAIYALERISRESPDDYWIVMETLTGFVRERAQCRDQTGETDFLQNDVEHEINRLPTDIAAVLTVITRRDVRNHERERHKKWCFDLTSANLKGAYLVDVHLEAGRLAGIVLDGADLSGACLDGARLFKARLDGARLFKAHLRGTILSGARLQRAILSGASLSRAQLIEVDLEGAHLVNARIDGADLSKARMDGADLSGSNLEKACLVGARLDGARLAAANLRGANLFQAHLEGADLQGVEGLTEAQLAATFGNAETKLPVDLSWPSHWPPPRIHGLHGGVEGETRDNASPILASENNRSSGSITPGRQAYLKGKKVPNNEAYSAEISRTRPSCVFLVVDQSASMAGELDLGISKAGFLADTINRSLFELAIACAKPEGVLDYFDVGAVAYSGRGVSSGFGGALAGDYICHIGTLARSPQRLEHRLKSVPDGEGSAAEIEVRFPIWFDPHACGAAPMCEALRLTGDLLADWCHRHPLSFPPIVLHITGGEATDGDEATVRAAARHIRSQGTTDGKVLLMNLHVSGGGREPIRFPATEPNVPNSHARNLFRISSVLPDRFRVSAEQRGITVSRDSRGYIYNAKFPDIAAFFQLGTRPVPLAEDR